MWAWLLGEWRTVGFVAASTVAIYLSAVAVTRIERRRTLAELSPFDFVVAVSLGSIIARVATTRSPTYVQGLAGLATLVALHWLVSVLRLRHWTFRQLVERRPLLLVEHGVVLGDALRRVHLTSEDLLAQLRQHDIHALEEVEAVVYESRGAISILRKRGSQVAPALLAGVVRPPQRRQDA
ncbi:MAG TPA: YetF domain-containing protein [Actinomycetota bacterium]|jgi:uncharacterized membrane protein YcaP (DUF421 family)|nr:YetF domain-containing protein [Actinomycetota bacterium]